MTTAYYEIASYHSIVRAKERLGYNEKNALSRSTVRLNVARPQNSFPPRSAPIWKINATKPNTQSHTIISVT